MSDKSIIVKSHDVKLDKEYSSWINGIKEQYRNTQIRAAIKVNSEQLMFYWTLGRDLVEKKAEEKWGSGVVEQVSLDLRAEFSEAKGFSTTNLWNMKKWYSFYANEIEKLHQFGGEFDNDTDIKRIEQLGHIDFEKLHQVGGEIDFPMMFAFVPWRHHVEIITKCKSTEEAIFYIKQTIKEGWSRRALINCIKADLYHSKGGAVTNFAKKLPNIQGKLAQEITKETYDLGFISLPPEYEEDDVEEALEKNITKFLLELGTGFTFVGRQKELIVAGKSRQIDMLFYHIRLKCYVVVELKVKPFEPEYAGKLNFYVNAVDELMDPPAENPAIGLLICSNMNETEVKWAFQGIETPMGVATYDNVRLKEIKSQLPSEEAIQKRLEQAEEEYILKLQQKNK